MTDNVFDIDEARDKRLQNDLNTMWDIGVASGKIHSPTQEELFFQLVLRDTVDRKCRAHNLITDNFNGEIKSCKIKAFFPTNELRFEDIDPVAEQIYEEIRSAGSIGYIYAVLLLTGPTDFAGNKFETRRLFLRYKE